MSELGETELNIRHQHRSPVQVVEMLRCFDDVGRKYKTYSDIWNASEETIVQGYLELILQELESMNYEEDTLEQYRRWLNSYGYKQWTELKERNDIAINKLRQFVHIEYIEKYTDDLDFEYEECWYWGRLHEKDYDRFQDLMKRYEKKIKRLEKVNCFDDLIHLRGIGPKTLEGIRKMQNLKEFVEQVKQNRSEESNEQAS